MDSAAEDATRRRGGWRIFLPVFVLTSLLSGLWALATPIFAAPDENAHAMKAIAQVHGQLVPSTRPDSRFPVVDVPDSYRYTSAIVCFAYHPERSAACAASLGDPAGVASFGTWVSSYNPVYYEIVGLPSLLFGGSAGVYAMRFVGALLASALLASAFTSGLSGRAGRWMPAALAFLATPMVVFLDGVISPQGIEVAAGAALWTGLLRLLERAGSEGRPTWREWLPVVFATSALALARATGPLWVVIVVAVCLVIAGRMATVAVFRDLRSYRWIGPIAVVGVLSLVWTAFSGFGGGQAAESDVPLVRGSFAAGAWAMIRNTPEFLQESAGVFGWLDTPLPPLVYATFFGAAAVLIILAFSAADRRGRWLLLLTVVVAFLVPVLVQASSISRTGLIWQGRYGMFLYVGVLIVAGWVLSRGWSAVALSVPVTSFLVIILGVYQIAAFVFVLRRYVVGMDDHITAMIRRPEWQPPGSWEGLVAILIVVEALLCGWIIRRAIVVARDAAPVGV